MKRVSSGDCVHGVSMDSLNQEQKSASHSEYALFFNKMKFGQNLEILWDQIEDINGLLK